MSGNPGLLALLWFGQLTVWFVEAGVPAVLVLLALRYYIKGR